MAIIKNPDGTIGNTISANKFMMDNNLQAKYRLLQSYTNERKGHKLGKKIAGTYGKDYKLSDAEKNLTQFNIDNFISKLQKFEFCPPSDNLWTIEITGQYDNTKLVGLYDNILSTNKNWSNQVGTRWKINMETAENTSKHNTKRDFMQIFQDDVSGLFLAQNVSFTPMASNVIDKPWSQALNNNMFLNFGNAATGRSESKNLNISFLISNWDICDILFDPWISAVGQKGLIEDEQPSIKAKIIISEFSSGLPKEYTNNRPMEEMKCRK